MKSIKTAQAIVVSCLSGVQHPLDLRIITCWALQKRGMKVLRQSAFIPLQLCNVEIFGSVCLTTTTLQELLKNLT